MHHVRHATSFTGYHPAVYFSREGGSNGDSQPKQGGSLAGKAEELPYVVEVWDDTGNAVDQTLAITANASIGYAAYYEATKEFPARYVTLRHKNRIVARWNAPGH
jgi:hypothetical protein